MVDFQIFVCDEIVLQKLHHLLIFASAVIIYHTGYDDEESLITMSGFACD